MVHKVLTVVGARPQFINAAAVSRAFKGRPGVRETMVHTGQHFDKKMSDIFFRIGIQHHITSKLIVVDSVK